MHGFFSCDKLIKDRFFVYLYNLRYGVTQFLPLLLKGGCNLLYFSNRSSALIFMNPSVLLYSSHNRCENIHRNWIVERALQHPTNKTLLFLPMSVPPYHQQSSWESFRWYFDRFRQWGLQPLSFYWNENLRKEDTDILFQYLINYEVVILGGGSSLFGMNCYRELGQKFYNNPNLFQETLQKRQKEGKLTVGFSAGASQLGQYLAYIHSDTNEALGFGLAKNIIITAHHEWGRETELMTLAKKSHDCLIFGLPNDSGIAIEQGILPTGCIWQKIHFILDYSWDSAQDTWHVKTRQGMKIEHFYSDGRHWAFNNGDTMLRLMPLECKYRQAWIAQSNGKVREYWSQNAVENTSLDEILEQIKRSS